MGTAFYLYDIGAGAVRIQPQAQFDGGFTGGLLRAGYSCQVAVDTIIGAMEARRMDFVFPGLDGGASLSFGLASVLITWRVQAIAALDDMENFEKALRKAAKDGARGTLYEEIANGASGEWPETEVRSVQPNGPRVAVGGPIGSPALQLYWQEWSIGFKWMQPTS